MTCRRSLVQTQLCPLRDGAVRKLSRLITYRSSVRIRLPLSERWEQDEMITRGALTASRPVWHEDVGEFTEVVRNSWEKSTWE